MRIDDIVHGCSHVIDEVNEEKKIFFYSIKFCFFFIQCTEELLVAMNTEIDNLSKKISNHELKHFYGIEDIFIVLQKELVNAKRLQQDQKTCADVRKTKIFISLICFFLLF